MFRPSGGDCDNACGSTLGRDMRGVNKAATMSSNPLPRILIVGGGFAGIAAAKALREARAQVAVVDRRNHHVFQPLLYQVATASLSPAEISSPIRGILRD